MTRNLDRFKVKLFNSQSNIWLRDAYLITIDDELILRSNTRNGLLKDFPSIIPVQSTNERDKNGKLIYEGDLILRPDKEEIYKISYCNDGCFGAFDGGSPFGTPFPFLYIDSNSCTIIGNIYENKDLAIEHNLI